MPFQITRNYPAYSLLTVYFSGLLLLEPSSDGQYCTVGIVNNAPPHKLKIVLKINQPNDAAVRKVLQNDYLHDRDFVIQVNGAQNPGVFAFQPHDQFYRDAAVDDGRDLRWSIDLQSEEFHYPERLRQIPSFTWPGVRINGGIFCTAERTDPDSIPVKRSRQIQGQEVGMTSIAAVLAARVGIMAGQEVLFTWEGDGGNPIRLPRYGDLFGTTYELEITNDPPDGTEGHDELEKYYSVLSEDNGTAIDPSERWHLSVGASHHDGSVLVKTDEIPCMPITLGP